MGMRLIDIVEHLMPHSVQQYDSWLWGESKILQWSLYYKTTPGDDRKWSYTAAGLLTKG